MVRRGRLHRPKTSNFHMFRPRAWGTTSGSICDLDPCIRGRLRALSAGRSAEGCKSIFARVPRKGRFQNPKTIFSHMFPPGPGRPLPGAFGKWILDLGCDLGYSRLAGRPEMEIRFSLACGRSGILERDLQMGGLGIPGFRAGWLTGWMAGLGCAGLGWPGLSWVGVGRG